MRNDTNAVGAVVFAVLMITSLFAGTGVVSAATTSPDGMVVASVAEFESGSATANDPYVITDASQLQNMSTDLDASYRLDNNIDASSIANFEPVGSAGDPFNGSFNGMGYTISNLVIDTGGQAGLFGYTDPHTVVENVTVLNVSVNGDGASVGGLIGNSQSEVTNVSVTGSVSGTGDHVGGIIGFKDAGNISNSNATVSVVTEGDNAGGIVGQNFDGAIDNSWAAGSVKATENVGGIAGENENLGSNEGIIKRSYATSAVTGQKNVGGVVGRNVGKIDYVYAVGPVSSETGAGGLAGSGFIGGNLYFDSGTTAQSNASPIFTNAGESLLTAELKGEDAKNNTEFNFTSNWSVVATDRKISYPFLRSNPQTPAPGLEIRIQNWTQLHEVRDAPGATYKLTADLNDTIDDYDEYVTPASGLGWKPIGNDTEPFTGSFDGQGHTISGLQINRSDESGVGLFGTIDNAGAVGNVTLASVDVTGKNNVGGFIGSAHHSAPIENVDVSGTVNATGLDTPGGTYHNIALGGLVGATIASDIKQSSTTVDVTANLTGDSQQNIGGLVGFADESDIQYGSASGDVTIIGPEPGIKVGGLVGNVTQGNISDSKAEGMVTGTRALGGLVGEFNRNSATTDRYTITNSSATGDLNGVSRAGGLVGDAVHTTIIGSTASGNITADSVDAGGLVGFSTNLSVIDSSASGAVTGTEAVGGIVGELQGGTIENVSTTGAVTGTGSGEYIGGLLGTDSSANPVEISNSSADGSVTGSKQVGGLAGELYGNVSGSYATGEVTGTGSNQTMGGLVGLLSGTVSASHATGNVSGMQTVGGLTGQNGGTVSGSYATGDVSGEGYVAGFAGVNDGTISTSHATGNVSGNSSVGGLVGLNGQQNPNTTVSESYATGTVSGSNLVGGLVGFNFGVTTRQGTVRADVSTSYATANVSGNSSVGGLVGQNNGEITRTFAAGDVTGSQSTGGLVGNASALDMPTGSGTIPLPEGNTTTSYWDTEATGQSTSAGNATGLTTSELKGNAAKANTAFNFTANWSVVDNGTHISYPYLQANTQTPAPGLELLSQKTDESTTDSDSNTANDESPTDTESTTAATSNRDDDDDDDRRSSRSRSGGSSGPTVSVSVTSTPGSDSAGDSTDETPDEDGETATDATDATDGTDDADDTDDQRPDTPAGKSVSVRGVGSGQTVGIDLSTDTDESESEADTEDAADDTQPTESEPARRNVIPDALDIAFKRSGDYDLVVTSRDIDVFAQAVETPGTVGDAETDGDTQSDSGVDEDTSPPVPDLSTDALDEDSKRFVSETNQRPVGFIEVDTKFDSSDVVEQATHKFRVRKSYLEATGASVDSVRLYRDEVDQWRPLPTRQTTEDDEFYYFEADTPGFSVFAIGTSSPVFEATSPVIESFDETTGTIEASVTVENVGSAPGEFTVPLVANDETIGSETASIDDGETASITVSGVITDPETVSLRIADRPLGELTAALPSEQSPEATAESTVGDDASTDAGSSEDADDQVRNEIEATELEDSSSSLDILGILVPIGALGLVLFFILWRRRDDEEDDDTEAAERDDDDPAE